MVWRQGEPLIEAFRARQAKTAASELVQAERTTGNGTTTEPRQVFSTENSAETTEFWLGEEELTASPIAEMELERARTTKELPSQEKIAPMLRSEATTELTPFTTVCRITRPKAVAYEDKVTGCPLTSTYPEAPISTTPPKEGLEIAKAELEPSAARLT